MKKKTPLIKAKPSKKEIVKKLLLQGKRLKVRQLDRMLDTNNSCEIIRTLRKEMPIRTDWVTSKNGVRHGVYSHQI